MISMMYMFYLGYTNVIYNCVRVFIIVKHCEIDLSITMAVRATCTNSHKQPLLECVFYTMAKISEKTFQ